MASPCVSQAAYHSATTASVVWLLALDFIFTRCVSPCPQNFNIGCCANEKPLRLIAHRRVRFFTFIFVSTLVLGARGGAYWIQFKLRKVLWFWRLTSVPPQYGIKGVRREETTWQWPDFSTDPERENRAQMARWSMNAAPDWHFPPLAIDRETNQPKRQRYRLVLVKCSRYEWIARDRSQEVYSAVKSKTSMDARTDSAFGFQRNHPLRICSWLYSAPYLHLPPIGIVQITHGTHGGKRG